MSKAVQTYQMIIDGQMVDSLSGQWIDVENPANKTVFARVPRGDRADVDRAVAAGKVAFEKWSRVSAAERARALHQIADALEGEVENLAKTISLENGNALRTQSRGEARLTVDFVRYVAGLCREIKGNSVYLSSENLDYTRREPFGVVGAIAGAVGIGLAGWMGLRKLSILRALRHGEVREARVTAVTEAKARINNKPQYVLEWVDAAGAAGRSMMTRDTKLAPYPPGSVIVVYVDPVTGRGWWDQQLG